MTIGEIKDTVAAYLQKDKSYFVKGSVDLLLVELNNARKQAEVLNQFNAQRELCRITVSPTSGGYLSDAIDPQENDVYVKDYFTFYIEQSDGSLSPLVHDPKLNVAVWTKERIQGARDRIIGSPEMRYPDDRVSVLGRTFPLAVYVNGDQVWLNPTQSEDKDLLFDAILWMESYSSDSDEDWMTQRFSDYLVWAACVNLNMLTLTWTPGLDGNLPPPIKLRDEALNKMIQWDANQVELGRQPRGRQ